MSLNNISLPSKLIEDLYQHMLVQPIASAVPVKKNVSFLGKNAKNILIIVNNSDAPYLTDNELNFLTTILSACQLGLGDVAIVNWNQVNDYSPADVFEQLKSKAVILFDVKPATFDLPAKTQLYTIIKEETRQFVLAPALSEIEKAKEAKKQLWMALKQLFGI